MLVRMTTIHLYLLLIVSLVGKAYQFVINSRSLSALPLPTSTSSTSSLNTDHRNIDVSMSSSVPLSLRIKNGLLTKYQENRVSRVLGCWDSFIQGHKVEKYLDAAQTIFQSADCYVDGLSATCFHTIDKDNHNWALQLESRYLDILSELKEYECNQEKMNVASEVNWMGPRDSAGTQYGPSWKTLGLQDRSVWDAERTKDFPVTIGILQQLKVPSCEVFFAKQGPNSGILPHTDKNNFIITCHIALDVPEGECWIQVGNEKYFWKNGKSVVFDTSITHSTANNADKTRYVLLIR